MPCSTRECACTEGYHEVCRADTAGAAHPAKEMHVIGALEIVVSVTSLLLVVLILLHRGKGGGLSDMFGGGFTSSFAGSSVVERNLDRFTLITAFVWFASIIGLLLLFKG